MGCFFREIKAGTSPRDQTTLDKTGLVLLTRKRIELKKELMTKLNDFNGEVFISNVA